MGQGWAKVSSAGTAPFYWHAESGQSQWALPLELCARPPTPGGREADWPETERRYFAAYGNWWKIQREMLSDHPRMRAYATAIDAHAEAIRGKVVIDVGAGTGVLSMLCAQRAAPRKVIAIEASDMARLARTAVAEQGLDSIIEVVHARVEDVLDRLPGLGEDGQADVIISEWMGTCLLGEGMLDSVLRARERWMRPGGLMLPQGARIWAAGWQHPALAELSMLNLDRAARAMSTSLLAEWAGLPVLESIPSCSLCTEAACVASLDLCSVSVDDLDTPVQNSTISLSMCEGQDAALWSGVGIWWDVDFGNGVQLSTSPEAPPTHWRQLLLVAPSDARRRDDGSEGRCRQVELSIKRDAELARNYLVSVDGFVYTMLEVK